MSDMAGSTSSPTSPELTVIVTTRNRADVLDETLGAIAKQTWDGEWELLVLDNGSTDGTPETLQRWLDRMPVPMRIVTAGERNNASYSRNTAVANTTARSVAFIDDDDVVGAGWVAAIGDALRTYPMLGSRFDYHLLNDHQLAERRHFQTKELGRFHDAVVVNGGGMACHRELWNAVGGSNEEFRTGQDIDFSLRVAMRGDVIPHFCEDAVYHMRLRDGLGAAFRQGRNFGRAWVHLYSVHGGSFGASRDDERPWTRRWLALVLRLRNLRTRSQRLSWCFDVGHNYGRLLGSVRHRTWCP